jgi:DNA primase
MLPPSRCLLGDLVKNNALAGERFCRYTILMQYEVELLKRQLPLLDYLKSCNWTGRAVGSKHEFVGRCPLHDETQPSFYVNAQKNLFFCHGCGRGGDLLRFVQLYLRLNFRDSVAHLKRELHPALFTEGVVLAQAVSFYHWQLEKHDEALAYLHKRGVHDEDLISRLVIGYAPGGNLRGYLTEVGCTVDFLMHIGLVDNRGRDSFYRRIVIPCPDSRGNVVNLYGRSVEGVPAHRFLARSKGDLFAWDRMHDCRCIILVEGLFDLLVLWQAGFTHTTCGYGIHLTAAQFSQLCDRSDREVFIVFDSDDNGAGQRAALAMVQRLRSAGLLAHVVTLPDGHDPNSYFVAGATAGDFQTCLQRAQNL